MADPKQNELVRLWQQTARADYVIAAPTTELLAGQTMLGKVDVAPTTMVLDGAGRIVWRHEGGLAHGELLRVLKTVSR